MMITITTNNEGLAKQVTVVSLMSFIFLFVILIHASKNGSEMTPKTAIVYVNYYAC